jgi:1-deoxyxylulose-5-phosphate synthase
MQYVRLGASSLNVSRISIGAMGLGDPSWRSWVLAEGEARPIVRRALDHGINLIDTCNYYSAGASEMLIGRLLDGFVARSDLMIATKFGAPMGKGPNQAGYSRKNVIDSCDASLKRLGVDYVDLYQPHIWDPSTNLEELVVALADLVKAGKVLYLGATDMPVWQFVKAVSFAKLNGLPHFVSMQNHYNLIWRDAESELFPYCRHEGIGLLPYSPIARGFLSGKHRNEKSTTERSRTDNFTKEWYNRANDKNIAESVEGVARARGVLPSQVALAWVLQQPGISSPIFGVTSVTQLDELMGAFDIKLSNEEIRLLEADYQPRISNAHGRFG